MAKLELNSRRASEGRALPGSTDLFAMTEIDGVARYILRGREPAIDAISKALGLALDVPINRASVTDGCSALHLGPDEWLLLIDHTPANGVTDRVGDAAADHPFSFVDISHRNVGFHLQGCAVVEALASGCPQSLELNTFPIGKCTRTVYAKAGIYLWRRDEHDFVLETSRSLVPYLLDYLMHETALL